MALHCKLCTVKTDESSHIFEMNAITKTGFFFLMVFKRIVLTAGYSSEEFSTSKKYLELHIESFKFYFMQLLKGLTEGCTADFLKSKLISDKFSVYAHLRARRWFNIQQL